MVKRSSFSRIDENVFLTMGVVVLLSLIILGFRFVLRKECKPVHLGPSENGPYFPGTRITFIADKWGETYEWDFGDGSPVVKTPGFSTSHIYKEDRKYTVTVIVNGSCSDFYPIHVQEHPPVKEIIPANLSFEGPTDVYVDQQVRFIDTAIGHTQWEWRVQGEADIVSYDSVLTYTFRKNVLTEVSLTVDKDNSKILRKTVNVVTDPAKEEKERAIQIRKRDDDKTIVIDNTTKEPPLPQPGPAKKDDPGNNITPATEAKKDYPYITYDDFGKKILDYNDSKISETEFDKYFCGTVSVSYKDKFMNFPEFLKDIKDGKGKIKEISVVLERADNSNCIKKVSVKIKRNKKLGIFKRD